MSTTRAIMSFGVAASILWAPLAYASDTRSSTALPKTFARSSIALKQHKSHLQQTGDTADSVGLGGASDGTYIIAGLGLVAIAGGVIIAVSKHDNKADSPG
jgi:hypothetical protein